MSVAYGQHPIRAYLNAAERSANAVKQHNTAVLLHAAVGQSPASLLQ